MYYDSHTHLNSPELFSCRSNLLDNFVSVGGRGLLCAGAGKEYNDNLIKIVDLNKHEKLVLKISLGYHPDEIFHKKIDLKNFAQNIIEMRSLISGYDKSVVAIGEAGIELHFPGYDEILDKQKELFAMQCDLAQELHLPLIIHSRDGFDQTLDVLKNYKDLHLYFHCRGYGPDEIRILNSKFSNLYIGFCGNVTYKRADALRESLKLVGKDQLLLETDAPYLSPQIVRGTQNEPANVRYIYDYVAEFIGKEKDVLQQQIKNNFNDLYKINP